jgi:hypothetical protein
MHAIHGEPMIEGRWLAWLGAVAGGAAVLVLAIAGARQMVARSDRAPTQDLRVSGQLTGSALICQTLVTRYPGLAQIRVRLATFGRQNSGMLTAHLRTAPQATQDLFTWTVDAATVQDNTLQAFDVVPAISEQGRTLAFCLAMPGGTPGNAIGVWGTRQDAYERGTAVVEGLPDAGIRDLVFELEYRVPPGRIFAVLGGRLAETKPMWWGKPWLYLVLGAAYVALLALLLYSEFCGRRCRPQNP